MSDETPLELFVCFEHDMDFSTQEEAKDHLTDVHGLSDTEAEQELDALVGDGGGV